MSRSPSARFPRRFCLLTLSACLIPLLAMPHRASAQPPPTRAVKFHPDSSYTAEALLRNAAGHSQNQQWDQAIEILQRVLRQHGGSMAQVPRDPADPLGGESTLFVDVRQYCQSQIAAMPPDAQAFYRRRIDPQAESWFREGLQSRSPEPFRRIVDQAFCSSWGDQALDRLGDIAFQDGRFGEALALYRRLVPDPDRPAIGLLYPNPDVDLALVAAKILLCRHALESKDPTQQELESYATQYPEASGSLAGRNGPYLASLIEAIRTDKLAPETTFDGRWPTFAGAADRNFMAPGSVDVGSFQWKVPLTPVEAGRNFNPNFMMNRRFMNTPLQAKGDSELAYHPIVVGDQVILCEANRIVAYNLNDRPEPTADSTEVPVAWDQPLTSAFSTRAARLMPSSPRYTLTSHGDRIYARLGPPNSGMGPSYIVAVRNSRQVEGKLLWKKSSSEIEMPRDNGAVRPSVSFEGSPVADDGNVYVALSESSTMTLSYVACLDAETGQLRWLRYLGEASPEGNPMLGSPFGNEVGNRLLSLSGSTLYYQTNMGAVAALDTATGAIRWLATYPRSEQRGSSSKRELTPAVINQGLVIVAPEDAPEIFAFDSATGRLVWKSQPLPEAAHLLGVVDNRLVATGNRVWLLDAATGKLAGFWPQGGAGLEGYGRGLLAGGLIYWPTRTEIRVLDPATGLEASSGPIALQKAFGTGGGNLAVGDGYLVIAQTDALLVFCQNRRLIDRYREMIAQAPDQSVNYVRLARVAEATGQDELAIENLQIALDQAKSTDLIDGKPIKNAAREQQFRILMRLGDRMLGDGSCDQAIRWFGIAATAAGSDRDRLAAQLRLAATHEADNNPTAAIKLLHEVLADESLRRLPVVAEASRTVRADRLIAERLARLLQVHGRSLYQPYEDRAIALFEKARSERNAHLIEEVASSYPVARIVPDTLLALGALEEEQEHFQAAARAYKRLLAAASSDQATARALLGLGRSYESQQLWIPARDAFIQAQSRFAALHLDNDEFKGSLGQYVDQRLERKSLAQVMADRAQPPLPAPLERRWSVRWNAPARPLAAAGVPPSPAAGKIFLVEGTTLRPIAPGTGAYAWSAELGSQPQWAGYLADHVLAATTTRLVALDLATGSTRWSFEAAAPPEDETPRNPFVHPQPIKPLADTTPPGPLHDFRLIGARVYCMRGDRELLAIDGDTGLVDWSFQPDHGSLHSRWAVDASRVVLQRREPHAIVVLDAETGTTRAEFPQSAEVEPWARDPWPIDDDHLAVVPDTRTVALLDIERGVYVWTYREPSSLPRSGPPRLLGDAGRLLVLRDGSELVRLDPATGKKMWSRVLGVEDLGDSPQALALNADRVFCACGPSPTLTAYNLDSGEQVWKRHLSGPASGWTLALTDRFLLAHPDPDRTSDDSLHSLPILLCAPEDGRLLQRFLLGNKVTDLSVRLAPGLALVATQDAGWALGPRGSLDLAVPAP